MSKQPPRAWALLAAIVLLATTVRTLIVDNQGLWTDEIFSIAMATGHSLEHPAKVADTGAGDWVESPEPLDPAQFRRYLEHDQPPAGFRRVLRAVRLSDTSPPLYYLLLNVWMRVLGTGDLALKLFSVLFALACIPFLWALARVIGGASAAVPTVALFALSPLGLYYSTEGRMYSLLWFFVAWLAWSTWKLAANGPRPAWIALWILASAGGLLTHYFFTFVWGSCGLWLFLHPGRVRRSHVVAIAAFVGLLVLPWYRLVPESFAGWRITQDWLHGYPPTLKAAAAPFRAAWSYVSNQGDWGGSRALDLLPLGVLAPIAVAVLIRNGRRIPNSNCRLVLFWLVAACLGPSIVDLLRQTQTSLIPRYALAGFPAGMLFLGMVIGRLRPRIRWPVLAAILIAWLPGIHMVCTRDARHGQAYREVAQGLQEWVTPSDLVLVHSIPSGVLGIARYLDADVGVASWVGQLGVRVIPRDIRKLIAGRHRVVFIEAHAVGEPAPEERWLSDHARVDRRWRQHKIRLVVFSPASGKRFPDPDR